MRPARLEDRLGRELVGRFKVVARARVFGVEKDHLATAATLLRLGTGFFVRQKILQRAEQKSAELSALRIGLGQRMFLLQMEAERLDQIFRVLFSVTAAARVCIKRIPICLEKLGQRLARLGIVFTAAGENNRPMRRVEAALGQILCLARHVLG